MYKAIKDGKIIAISDTDSDFFCILKDNIKTDEEHKACDYKEYNGEYLLKSEIPSPSYEEQVEKRAYAYACMVDPITAHIARLRDMENTEDIVEKINSLITERDIKVQEIKELYPYPVEF